MTANIIRLYTEVDLVEDALIEATPDQTHYLVKVMRVQDGETIKLFNGRDGEWQSNLVVVSKKHCSFKVGPCLREQAEEPDVWLLFAPIKRHRLGSIVEKATELGASGLWPVITAHTVAHPFKHERLVAQAIEAAEQCERLTVPMVREPAPLPQVLADWPAERRLFFLDETGGGRPIAEGLMEAPPGPHAFLIGPEGGFAQSELDALRKLPFAEALGLGPRILKADTAAIAALVCHQALRGDWLRPPRA